MTIIPPELTPLYLDHLKAKSFDEKTGHQQTLAEHTWLVLSRLADQVRLRRPHFADNWWQQLYWACFFHDFGKAAQGFQERLQPDPSDNDWSRGRHRHEVLSLAFIDWLFPPGHPDRLPVIGIVVSHHKDAKAIFEKYGAVERKNEQVDRLHLLINQLAPETPTLLWNWLCDFGLRWQAHLEIPIVTPMQPAHFEQFGVASMIQALDDYAHHLNGYSFQEHTTSTRTADLLYRGLIFTADHAASAGAGQFPPMPVLDAEKPLHHKQWRQHQTRAAQSNLGSALLIAPTGSGKTEAALLWAETQLQLQPAARLFYTLPYQASMNAMVARLLERYFSSQEKPLRLTDPENQIIMIQHSRALLKYYQEMMNDERSPRERTEQAKWLKNLARLNYYPIQVFSPYQMLKAAYSLKGYEVLLVDYAQALFIFDEIHAYEPKRLAMIITFMGWLREHLGARFFVMTATLPPMIQQKLLTALQIDQPMTASADDFAASQRHQVHLKPGEMSGQIVTAVQQEIAAGQSVLVCCNRIADAQAVYQQLEAVLPEHRLILLHSRFNGRDRKAREDDILQQVGVGRLERQPLVVVATQVVEVSLDVDFDVLYTDPAPLEALLQRFGRVNRGRQYAAGEDYLRPVYVFEQPCQIELGKEISYKPYDEALVKASIKVLAQKHGQAIDESTVTTMLGEIYQGAILDQWEKDYATSTRSFQRDVLNQMTPFQSADESMWRSFYEMFEGIEILPEQFKEDYDTARRQSYLKASELLVSLSLRRWQIKQLMDAKVLWEEEHRWLMDAPYTAETGLDLGYAMALAKARLYGTGDDQDEF